MTKESSIKGTIAQIDLLLNKEQYREAFELLDKMDISALDNLSLDFGYILYFTALCLHQQSKCKAALLEAQKAFDILRNSNKNKRIAQIQALLGDIYYNIGDLEQAETEYRDALTIFRRIEDNKWVITVCNGLARICFLQSDFEKAIGYLKDAIRISKESGDISRVAALTHNLSTVYRKLGKWSLSEETNLLALDIATKVDPKLNPMRYLFTLGYTIFLQRRFTEAGDYYRQAFEFAKEANELLESSIFYEYQGELYFVQSDFIKARELYSKALEIGEKIAPQGDIINQTCRLLAELELSEGNLDEAINQCNRSLEVSLRLKDRFEEGIVYRILGNIYFNKKDNAKTRENFEKSIKVLKEIKAIYELGRSYLEAGKSNCFNYFERLKFLGNAQDLFSEVDTKYHIAHTDLAISQLLYDNDEFNKALSFAQEAEEIFKKLGEKKDLEKAFKFRFDLEKRTTHLEESKDIPFKFSFSSFITQNKEMLDIIHKAEQVKDKDITILVQGETGTGKDLLVRMIHYNSNRADKKFIALNCANLPEALLESELFGHKKGAFTGANVDKKGLLEVADGGTLFLNEIGELPLSVQAKLLSVLEEKEFTRLGDTNPMKVDVRIIAATNRNLEEAVENRAFREDLYYRLGVIKLNLSPLRERKEDIKLLIGHFLEKHADGSRDKVLEASKRLNELFMSYDWPGNVRELENEIIKLSTLIEIKDQDGLNRLIEQIEKEKRMTSNLPDSLLDKKERLEKSEIANALRATNNVKSDAARMLDIPESTLRSKIKKLNITL
ncbi:MAG: sigma 54-interacting transcriptional regulator [candidate division Zixibacteria bacterium]|nr:sigma 54-interacting transcriptional regulator [candidate division Zixibacteria bacterium]